MEQAEEDYGVLSEPFGGLRRGAGSVGDRPERMAEWGSVGDRPERMAERGSVGDRPERIETGPSALGPARAH